MTTQEELAIAEDQINILADFCRNRLSGFLEIDGDVTPINLESLYDVVRWLQAGEGTELSEFEQTEPVNHEFFYTEDQIRSRDDQFKRYGADLNAMAKIMTRGGNVGSLFRKVGTRDGELLVSPDIDVDQFTRYTLAG